MSAAHLVDDLYQGTVPALIPYFVAERQYGYAAVSGLVLASSVLGSVAQPVFGWWTDRRPRRWMIPVGMSVAAAGVIVSTLTSAYVLTLVALAISGLGVAAFHPEAARAARQAAGESAKGMSIFALGGNLGFALGPVIATPILLAFGLDGTWLLAFPVLAMAMILVIRLGHVLDGPANRPRTHPVTTGIDDWPRFRWLTGIVMVRSVMFFGLTAFLALYFIDHLGAEKGLAGAALGAFLLAGAGGTLLGGWLADRTARLVSLRLGFALVLPAMAGLLLAPDPAVAMVFVVLTGVALFVPFSVFVVMGQDYLPNRIGTASGVTVGLAVGAGGIANPLLGLLAEEIGLRTALASLLVIPVIALLLTLRLREPGRPGRPAAASPQGAEPTA